MFKYNLGRTASRSLACMAIVAAALTPVSAWSSFAVIGTPGSTANDPLLPVVINNRWNFNFSFSSSTGRVFIDPVVAIGYDYILNSGPNFATVLLPTNIGDGIYDFWTFDSVLNAFVDSGIDITGGQTYDFGVTGISKFSIRGIEVSAQLDPTNVTAFVTGLTFTGPGVVNMDMLAVTANTTPSAIPLPGTLALGSAALLGLLCVSRSRRTHVR